MGFELTAIEIAAIAAAGLAVLVVLVFIIYTFRRRSTSRSRKRSPKPKARSSPNRPTDDVEHGWGFGWTSSPSPSPPFSGYPPGPSPSTGSGTPGSQTKSPATGSTTLVTPTSSSSKLKKGAASPLSGKKFKTKTKAKPKTKSKKGKSVDTPSPAETIHRPESEEMVMVTYEQGLANMGMVRPHHILRYSEPPPFDEARQAYPVHTPEGRYPPGSAEIIRGDPPRSVTGSGTGSDRSPGREKRVEPQRTAGRRRGEDGQSTWLPSYYRSPESNRRNLDDEESDLGYRAGEGIDGRARYPGWI